MVGEGVGGVGGISTARPADVAASTCFPWAECFTEISYSCCLHCRNLRCNPNMSQNACDVNIPIPCYLN